MNFWDEVMQKWELLRKKAEPILHAIGKFLREFWKAILVVWHYIKALKKLWIAIPIGAGAILLALHNLTHLPKVVGLNLQTDGLFALQIPREMAVFFPLGITLICLLLMLCSRRTLTPWFVSLVSLAIPVVILILNTFPG